LLFFHFQLIIVAYRLMLQSSIVLAMKMNSNVSIVKDV